MLSGAAMHAHSNWRTPNARLSFLFVEPDAADLPKQCCTLAVSPMIREMIRHLGAGPRDYETGDHTGRLVRVLLDELALMPTERLHLPVSDLRKFGGSRIRCVRIRPIAVRSSNGRRASRSANGRWRGRWSRRRASPSGAGGSSCI
jgi:hypothetical protein